MNRFHKLLLTTFGLIALELLFALFFPFLRTVMLLLLAVEAFALILLPILKNKENKSREAVREKLYDGKTIQLDHGIVRYKLSGDGNSPVLIMINGFPMPLDIWERNAPDLAKNYRVLQFDLWGFGGSDTASVRCDADLYGDQIIQLVHKLKLKGPFHLAAFSIGCTIAGRLAERSSEFKLGKIVLIGPVVRPMNISPYHWPIIGEYLTCLFIGQAMLNIFGGNFFYKKGLEKFRGLFFGQLQVKGFRKAWLSCYRNLFPAASPHIYKALAEHGTPVMILSGREDRIVSLDDSRLLQRELGWPLTLVENGGHSVQFECPEQVNAEIDQFLKEDAVCLNR
ncbi:alpha/beta fold hydrolase [Paenibacillus tarimensis]|uniref:alpha/beta fold hydrolase n=1 Tax=Paenibacillus tarimensis TaxID=416012 RepID=UPI001F1EB3D8|nr:alpha/beta hydrolase [Paenibacillus tarimensis]MCF2943982.1 alpha/beta hydrolase [Paenibacillus tarimensis]